MYVIFTPNKVFVQFQLDEYFSDSAELNIVFTSNPRISLKDIAQHQKKQKVKGKCKKAAMKKHVQKKLIDFIQEKYGVNINFTSNPRISLKEIAQHQKKTRNEGRIQEITKKKHHQKKLTDFVQELPKTLIESPSKGISNDLPSPVQEDHGFNIIPLNYHENETQNSMKQEDFKMPDHVHDGKYYLQGYWGRQLPFTARLQEIREITSRYTPGLLHENYLEDFHVFDKLKEFGVKKNGGFSIEIIFLSLYYISFATCSSFDRFTSINSEEFSILINNLSKPKADTLRQFLKRTITMEIAVKFSNFIYYRINQLDSWMGFAAYIDEHLVKYQGTKKMAKGKGGGKNKVEKGFYRFYLTCGLFSIPLFTMSKDGSKRLEKVIFEVLEAEIAVTQKKIRLVMFDRGIKSFKTLKELHEAGYNFICWSFPYKTIKQALKWRHRLKMVRISTMIKELLKIREQASKELKVTGRNAEMREFFKQVLPIHDLRKKLRQLENKEKGIQKWNSRDFISIRDIQINFEGYGLMRTIILEKQFGEKMAIFTDLPSKLVHPIEILMVLKKKQNIEDFFSYKRAIQGDYIPFWELKEALLQKTRFDNERKKPGPKQVVKFEKRMKRLKNDLKRIVQESRTWKKLFKKGKISKRALKKQEKDLTKEDQIKKAKLKEIRAFLKWARKDKRPPYFDQFEPVLELNPRIEMFLNAINDLFFVNSRRIASDWSNSLRIAKSNGELTVSDKKIKEISNFTPEKLTYILLKGGGKALLNPNDDSEIIVELHTELLYKDEILIAPYLKLLGQLTHERKHYFDTRYTLKFTNNLLDVPRHVKIV